METLLFAKTCLNMSVLSENAFYLLALGGFPSAHFYEVDTSGTRAGATFATRKYLGH